MASYFTCLCFKNLFLHLSLCLFVAVVYPANTAELIEMPFGMWTQVGPRKHILDEVHISATWRIRLNRPCATVMRPCVKLLWPLM